MKHIRTCFHTLLDPGLDFRVRLFNILAIGGMACLLYTSIKALLMSLLDKMSSNSTTFGSQILA